MNERPNCERTNIDLNHMQYGEGKRPEQMERHYAPTEPYALPLASYRSYRAGSVHIPPRGS